MNVRKKGVELVAARTTHILELDTRANAGASLAVCGSSLLGGGLCSSSPGHNAQLPFVEARTCLCLPLESSPIKQSIAYQARMNRGVGVGVYGSMKKSRRFKVDKNLCWGFVGEGK